MKARYRILLVLLFAAWMVLWFRGFAFQFSFSVFQTISGKRLTILAMTLLTFAVAPLSAYRAVSRSVRNQIGLVPAAFVHFAVSAVPLGIFHGVITFWVISARRAGRLAFEADEAMGIGIDFLQID